VLEVGAGTGYQAAILAHLVGRLGRVTTIELDPEVADGARRALAEHAPEVAVETGDGCDGWPAGAP
jgi:protein-L-isoaspartate(D-aspartate) O-methyltransferase